MSTTQHRPWRIFGTLAIGYLVVEFAALAVENMTPELGSTPHTISTNLMHGSMTARFAGGYVEALSQFIFLAAALLLVRLLRGTGEWTGWLADAGRATAVLSVGSAIIVGFPAGAAALYDGHHGASLGTVTALNDLRNFAFFLSVASLGLYTICVAAALLATRGLPRWLGWSGLVVGVACVVAVAGARNGAHNAANLLQMVWWVALGVTALARRDRTAAPAPRADTTAV